MVHKADLVASRSTCGCTIEEERNAKIFYCVRSCKSARVRASIEHRALELVMKRRCAAWILDRAALRVCHRWMRVCASAYECSIRTGWMRRTEKKMWRAKRVTGETQTTDIFLYFIWTGVEGAQNVLSSEWRRNRKCDERRGRATRRTPKRLSIRAVEFYLGVKVMMNNNSNNIIKRSEKRKMGIGIERVRYTNIDGSAHAARNILAYDILSDGQRSVFINGQQLHEMVCVLGFVACSFRFVFEFDKSVWHEVSRPEGVRFFSFFFFFKQPFYA